MPSSIDANNSVELKEVRKAFNGCPAVDGISLTIKKGEAFALLGPSGAGKTTLTRLINGVDRPDSGRVLIEDQDVTDVPAHKRPVNTVFQDLLLFPHLTVFGNIAYPLRLRKNSAQEIRTAVNDIMEVLGIEALAHRMPLTLSGGQQQRVAIARAVVSRPAVLICDEPLASLDPELRAQILDELTDIRTSYGLTIILVTHHHEDALTTADQVCIIQDGKIVQTGSPSEIYDHPRSIFIANFVGETNVFEATDRQGREAFRTHDGLLISVGKDLGEVQSWGLRPEKLTFNETDNTEAGVTNTIKGRIGRRANKGSTIRYDLELECGRILKIETLNTSRTLAIGEKATVSFSGSDLVPLLDGSGA